MIPFTAIGFVILIHFNWCAVRKVCSAECPGKLSGIIDKPHDCLSVNMHRDCNAITIDIGKICLLEIVVKYDFSIGNYDLGTVRPRTIRPRFFKSNSSCNRSWITNYKSWLNTSTDNSKYCIIGDLFRMPQ